MRSRQTTSQGRHLARWGTLAAAVAAVSGVMTAVPPSASADVTIGAIGATASSCASGRSWVQAGTNSASPSYAVPAGINEITQWRAEGNATGTTASDVVFEVWRPTGTPGRYTLVGKSASQTVAIASTDWYTLDPPIDYVHQGDLIGLYLASSGLFCHRITTNSDDRVMQLFGSEPTVTASYTFDMSVTGRLSNLEATGTWNASKNEPPVAVDDSYTTPAGTSLTIQAPGVLANDTDPTGDTIAVASGSTGTTTTSAGGTVSLEANGSFTYDPPEGFVGSDTFTYQATDTIDTSSATTVTIAVPGPIDLDGLGGGYAELTSTDGRWASGLADTTGDAATHGVAVDLSASSPQLRDLGTLGGTDSAAYGVDGGWVIGESDLSGDATTHAFAYNLNARSPAMLDLGTLGGVGDSHAYDVDAGRAVGQAATSAGPGHAFVVNLAARRPALVDLGTLPGGTWSNARAVAGAWAVGEANSGSSQQHGIAWNLSTPPGAGVDLPPLSGDTSATASAVSGEWAVGQSWGTGVSHAVAWHLTDSSPSPVLLADLGGGTDTYVSAVDGTWAVGQAESGGYQPVVWDLTSGSPSAVTLSTEGGDTRGVRNGWAVGTSNTHAFAVDLTATDRSLVDLGSLGEASSAMAVGGGWAVGQTRYATGNPYHATAFRIADMLPASADLAVTVTGDAAAHAGKPYTASVTVTNAGPSNATGVTLTIDGTSVTPFALAKGVAHNETVTVTAGAGGKGATLTVSATVSPGSGVPDTNMSNNTGTLAVPIRGRG